MRINSSVATFNSVRNLTAKREERDLTFLYRCYFIDNEIVISLLTGKYIVDIL